MGRPPIPCKEAFYSGQWGANDGCREKIYSHACVLAMVFPVVMYGCESGTIKKAEHCRIETFKLLCWRRLLRAPWTARRSNQSILKEINPEYSLEGLKLNFQCFWPLDAKSQLIEKDPDAGND